MFFGTVLKPGKKTPVVPHADGFALHLSQASLAADVKPGRRASVLVKVEKEEPVVLCTLCAGTQDTVLLDQFMTEYAELTIQGSVPVHITGYYSPEYGPEGQEEEEGEDADADYHLAGHPMAHMMYGLPGADSESEEGESGDEDEDNSMDDSSDEGESSDDGVQHHKEPSVIIEDITDQENAKAGLVNGDAQKDKKKRKAAAALPAPENAAAAKKQAVAADQKQQQQPKQQKESKPGQKQQPKQQTPADKKQQQQQQQKTPAADRQQQPKQQQQQAQRTPQGTPAAGSPAAQSVPSSKKNVRVFENGFEIHNVKMGDPHGKLAKGGKNVKVKYVGRLKNGTVFDKTGNKPFTFRLGVGEVIKGWDRGVEGMRVGDKRKLVIPPQMGYGAQKTGPIPANSWLDFDVELVDVK